MEIDSMNTKQARLSYYPIWFRTKSKRDLMTFLGVANGAMVENS